VPVSRYLRSLDSMAQIYKVYVDDRKLEEAYVLQIKMVVLFIKHLKTHPEYQKHANQYPKDVNRRRQMCNEALKCAEVIKMRLLEKFAAEKIAAEKEEERVRLEAAAQKTKAEMWKLEEERRRLEDESKRAADEMELFEQEQKRKEAEEERQKLLRLYPTPAERETPADIPTIPSRSAKPELSTAGSASAISIVRNNSSTPPSGSIRTVNIPTDISSKFLALSAANNRRNIETCGLLFGVAEGEAFKITHCMLPKQTGTHDSCVTTNEEQIWKFQDERLNLIMLGWIHTHPDYNVFLSSVDMHNQFLYQCLLPEALAVVVSPKFSEVGAFHLTPKGLDVIGSCRQKGFHPHSKHPPLFEAASNAQFVGGNIEMIDWR